MKYWEYAELEKWETIREKLNRWIDTTSIVQSSFFWNTVPVGDLMRAAPELRGSLFKLGTTCTYAAIIVARPHSSSMTYLDNIHVDDMPGVAFRLQLPIRNTESSFTHFFSAPKDKIQRKLLPNGHAFWWIDAADAKHETKVCIDRPTYIRTGEPHSVEVNPKSTGVRITATLRLSVDPMRMVKGANDPT